MSGARPKFRWASSFDDLLICLIKIRHEVWTLKVTESRCLWRSFSAQRANGVRLMLPWGLTSL